MKDEKEEVLVADANLPRPWYFTDSVIMVAFLGTYPFVLPLVWLNPYYTSSRKVFLTFLILVVSAVLIKTVLLMVK